MSSVIENSNSIVANGFPSDHSDAALSDIDREEKQRLIKQIISDSASAAHWLPYMSSMSEVTGSTLIGTLPVSGMVNCTG
ncbi:unnamed protein product [Hymenolepis diminuta]|uniref:Uncharacterized protein n=1 Tax=Hymenolepis diminuta TaxID=6216 RepID=A0A564ZDY3_HYMDI|nr:unnamed protein product [Hymenolepis diminuta]